MLFQILQITKKQLKDPSSVAKIIQDLGFYDGDIFDLAGIDMQTGQIDTSTKITGTSIEKNTEKKSITTELKELKKLYDEGVLTKEEFEKAKKKLLN